MSQAGGCCGAKGIPFVLACSGGSNVGQLSNEAAKVLDQAGEARMSCLAGLGGHVSGLVAAAQEGALLVIDGCGVACAQHTVKHLGLAGYAYLQVTDCGIEKGHHFNLTSPQVEQVAAAARAALAAEREKI